MPKQMTDFVGVDSKQLLNIVQRIEALNAEKKDIGDRIKDIYGEAKLSHLDVPTVRQIVRERAKDPDDTHEGQRLLDLYRKAIGLWEDTPLGEYEEDTYSNAAE